MRAREMRARRRGPEPVGAAPAWRGRPGAAARAARVRAKDRGAGAGAGSRRSSRTEAREPAGAHGRRGRRSLWRLARRRGAWRRGRLASRRSGVKERLGWRSVRVRCRRRRARRTLGAAQPPGSSVRRARDGTDEMQAPTGVGAPARERGSPASGLLLRARRRARTAAEGRGRWRRERGSRGDAEPPGDDAEPPGFSGDGEMATRTTRRSGPAGTELRSPLSPTVGAK